MRSLFSAIFFLFFFSILGYSNDLKFRHLTIEDGLSSNSVRAILQDKNGFIWVGTSDGLNRYDGINIKNHPLPLSNKYISSLCEINGDIWIGTDEVVLIYNPISNNFKSLDAKTNKGVGINGTVNSITTDRDNNVWISTSGQGIFKYNIKTKKLKQYPFVNSSGLIASVTVNSENQVFAVTSWGEYGLYKLNKSTDAFEIVSIVYDRPGINSRSLVFFEDSEKNHWIGSWECGIQKLDIYTGKVETYLHPSDVKGTMHIHSIMEYAPHQLLIGSDDGLLLFNTSTKKFVLYEEDDTNIYSLSNRFVYPIVKDGEGGVWIGTYYGGMNYIPPRNSIFESYNFTKKRNSIGGNVISKFCEDKNGQIWIASDDGGLNRFNPITKIFTQFMPERNNKNSLSYHNVHALCIDGDQLWIGTYTGGVNLYNIDKGTFKVYSSTKNNPKTLDGTSSYAIFKDNRDNIWVATMSGINLYDRKNDNFKRVKNFDALTIDIDQDKDGNLWFATQGKGIYKYNPRRNQWKNYTSSNNKSGSLPTNQINCININQDNEIYIATNYGLYKYLSKNDSFQQIKLSIPSNNICSIIEDQNVFWLTTTKGLVRYTPGEGCQVFTKSDGLQCDQFMPNSGFKSSDGKIYIGSVNGFNSFYPYQININRIRPKVVLTGLEIFNKDIPIGSSILPKDINYLPEIHLSYRDNVISLNFASLSYCIPGKNQYSYKLEGFDKEWNNVGSQNKATYTNLPAGTYVFRVNATNNDGLWNKDGATIRIVIHPPFYWSTSFKIIYVLLFIIALFFLIKFFVKRSEKRHSREINIINENKEKELHEAKIQFFTMIAHEIRTPVSLIIAPLEKIQKMNSSLPKFICDDLDIIDRNSQRLLFLVNQLLDFRKAEQGGLKLKYSLCSVNSLILAVSDRFRPTIEQQGIKFVVELSENDFSALIDKEAATKLISNLLTNARKYTKDIIVLSCTLNEEKNEFSICVKDNGCGISDEEKKKIFKPFYQSSNNKPGTGIGLSIVKNIVDAHNGTIEVDSTTGGGSSFIVTLPIGNGENMFEEDSIEDSSLVPEDIIADAEIEDDNKEKQTILIVDDNKDMLKFLSVNFCEKYNTITAEDGEEALKILKKNDISFIISDLMMPKINGIELCKAVRSNNSTSHIAFILLTAKTDINSKIEGMDCGADAYIEKPFSIQYLEACIKNIIDIRALLRQKFSRMPLMPISSIAANSLDDQFLQKMNELIEQNFSNPELTVDFLTEKLCISRSGLFAKIKSLANVTPNELIQLVRLKKAAMLLLENKYRINEICYMVGFNNPSYFSKCFQKQFGVKPGEFIENGGATKD